MVIDVVPPVDVFVVTAVPDLNWEKLRMVPRMWSTRFDGVAGGVADVGVAVVAVVLDRDILVFFVA